MRVCSVCGVEKDDAAFPGRRVKCRVCAAARQRALYHERHRLVRMAERKERSFVKKVHVPTVPESERAYAAGIVDGEGSIRLVVRQRPVASKAHQRGKQGVGQVQLQVTVTNTCIAVLDWINARWHGGFRRSPANPILNRKAIATWVISSTKALHFLDDIWPFLIVRRPQAKIARRFQRYIQRGGYNQSDKRRLLQLRMASEIKRLNWRGIRPPTEQDLQFLVQIE